MSRRRLIDLSLLLLAGLMSAPNLSCGGGGSAPITASSTPTGEVTAPVITPVAGTYANSVSVVISCSTPGAEVFYTLDGSTPTVASARYAGSFTIAPATTGTTTVKALAAKTGLTASAVSATAYAITKTAVAGSSIADHSVAKDTVLRAIPASAIDAARRTLHVAYNHTSHGTHVSYGVYGLPGFKPGDAATFAVTSNAAADPNKLDLKDNQISGAFSDLSQADADWTAWRDQVRAYLDHAANARINVMLWSWCDITGHSVPGYLSSMQTLINEYGNGGTKIGTGAGKTRTVPVAFIFMTGHANANANVGAGNPRDQAKLITDYCTANGYYCIDYYSIDTHAMDGAYFEDADADANSAAYSGNYFQDWQAAHAKGSDWYENRTSPGGSVEVGNHTTQHITANRKAYAFWWVLARITGWDGGL